MGIYLLLSHYSIGAEKSKRAEKICRMQHFPHHMQQEQIEFISKEHYNSFERMRKRFFQN